VDRLGEQISRYLSFEHSSAATLVNNLDWTKDLSAIDFLRDVGKHYRVGTMIKKDAVSARLNSDAGISYTEFSYQILQGMDFLRLYENYGCVLQTGGSDQWGNLTSGTDLIHKALGVSVHALGTPLITNSDGTKFGKSEGNAIWLDGDFTSPFAMYQFWLNTDDRDVIERLKVFTFLSRWSIEELDQRHSAAPHERLAQKALAHDVTALVHGPEACNAVVAASEALFGKGDLATIDPRTFESALDSLPRATVTPSTSVAEALVQTGLCSSVSEARRAIAQGGVSINNNTVVEETAELGERQAPSDVALLLKRGKKTLAALFFV
jgi:tyrosyl-tRNA synthetase